MFGGFILLIFCKDVSLVLVFSLNGYKISSLLSRNFGIVFVRAFAIGGACIDACVGMTACKNVSLLICQKQGCVLCRSVEYELRLVQMI
jgi:hypothetical protein